VFAADFETDLTTAGLPEASPALAGGLAADLPFFADTGAALAAGLTAGLATGLATGFATEEAFTTRMADSDKSEIANISNNS
jgi:hypothetical protein